MSRIGYLGPEGTFTHQAALTWADAGVLDVLRGADLVPLATVGDICARAASGEVEAGVVAIENTVEGYVAPSLEAIMGATNVIAVDEVVLGISFDAFVHPDATGEFAEVSAHPHGLAQCGGFVTRSGLTPIPATSNAAACRDIMVHQIALGPAICGELYGLRTHARAVEDFHGARTRFLLLTQRTPVRDSAGSSRAALALDPRSRRDEQPSAGWRTMLAVTPHLTGPGVLARITQAFGASGVNLSSLITRPLKAQEGKYVFVITVDAAPWEPSARAVFGALLEAGDSLKTLGVYPGRGGLGDEFDSERVPLGSVRATASPDEQASALLWD